MKTEQELTAILNKIEELEGIVSMDLSFKKFLEWVLEV